MADVCPTCKKESAHPELWDGLAGYSFGGQPWQNVRPSWASRLVPVLLGLAILLSSQKEKGESHEYPSPQG